MERSETLAKLRGDTSNSENNGPENSGSTDCKDYLELRQNRFPDSFIGSTPENAQRIILWCLEQDPQKRPSSQELLKASLLLVDYFFNFCPSQNIRF